MDKNNSNNILQGEDIERSVLAYMLRDSGAMEKILAVPLRAEYFSKPEHFVIFNTILEIELNAQEINADNLINILQKRERLELVGGEKYIRALSDFYSNGFGIDHNMQAIKDRFSKKRLLEISDHIQSAVSCGAGYEAILEKTHLDLFELIDRLNTAHCLSLNDMLTSAIADIDDSVKEKRSYIQLGFPELDKLIGSLYCSNYIVILGNSDLTSLALSMLINVGLKGVPAAFFSPGITGVELTKRMLSIVAKIKYKNLFLGYLTYNELLRLTESAEKLHYSPLCIIDKPNIGVLDIYAEAKRLNDLKKISAIFINQMDLIRLENPHFQKYENLAAVSKYIKGLSRELGIPVIVLSCLDPGEYTLYPWVFNSGVLFDIKNDADTLIVMKEINQFSKAELRLEKSRSGKTGVVEIDLPIYR